MNKFNIGDIVKSDTDKEFTVAAMRLHAGNILYFSDIEGIVGRSEEDLTLVRSYLYGHKITGIAPSGLIMHRRMVTKDELKSLYPDKSTFDSTIGNRENHIYKLVPPGVKLISKKECNHDWNENKVLSNFSTYDCKLCGAKK